MSQPESDATPSQTHGHQPVIPAATTLPELTFKAVLLGLLLSVVLAGANAYLGLFAGMTVSASIPAAVVSMAVLRAFRRSNILENNLVQTAASAGESLAAGVIFTIPALVLMGWWTTFNYWEVTAIAGVGGIVGVLFTIPLRRALVIEEKLLFPEGVATAEVLKTGGAIRDRSGETQAAHPELANVGGNEQTQRRSILALAVAGLVGAGVKFAEAGMFLWSGTLEVGTRALGTVWVIGMNLSPALVSVGYIVGLNIATLVFGGGVIAWLIAIPIYVAVNGMPAGTETAIEAAGAVWNAQIRYLGVGAMVVGGLWALINLLGPVKRGISSGLQAYSSMKPGVATAKRTDLDLNMRWVLVLTGLCVIPIFAVYQIIVHQLAISMTMALIMLVAGFFFAAVAGYMAGLVGSSNNPISGVTIATLLFTSLLLLMLLGADSAVGPAAAIFVGAVVACAAAISGDTMQDLKAGHIVGATPWKQQIMEFVGVISAAFVMSPVLFLLQARYGIGAPPAGNPTAQPLAAPQATLMASVAEGVFGGGLPWTMVTIGMGIAVALIALDQYLETRGSEFRTPVLAVAVGIYLPLELTSSIFIGGLIAWYARKKLGGREPAQTGLLFASGLITGEALVGILLALPIVLGEVSPLFSADMFQVFAAPPLGGWPGLVVLGGICLWMLSMATQQRDGS